jgi:hypothetical protein
MIEIIEAVNNVYKVDNNGTKWVVNVNDNEAVTLQKFAGRIDSEDKIGFMQSIYPTFACVDMLELINYLMSNGIIVKEPLFSQVIDYVISDNHAVSDGVTSGFADYLTATGIKADLESIKKLEDYCLENSFEFDARLLELV